MQLFSWSRLRWLKLIVPMRLKFRQLETKIFIRISNVIIVPRVFSPLKEKSWDKLHMLANLVSRPLPVSKKEPWGGDCNLQTGLARGTHGSVRIDQAAASETKSVNKCFITLPILAKCLDKSLTHAHYPRVAYRATTWSLHFPRHNAFDE